MMSGWLPFFLMQLADNMFAPSPRSSSDQHVMKYVSINTKVPDSYFAGWKTINIFGMYCTKVYIMYNNITR